MSQNDWNDETTNEGGPAGLRKYTKKLEARLAELEGRLAGTMERERKFNLNEELASRGLDPRVAKFYPQDAATDSESVNKWVEENRDLFGGRQIQDDQHDLRTTTLTDLEVQGYKAQQAIAAYDSAVQMDLETRLKQAESADEVMALLKTYAPPTM